MMEDKLYQILLDVKTNNLELCEKLNDECSILDYSDYAVNNIWTTALQNALLDHEIVVVPPRITPYLIDDTIIIPSNRKLVLYGATLLLSEGTDVLMMRNEHPVDQTHSFEKGKHDDNITLLGGTIMESRTERAGYGRSGKFDHDRSMYGVSTCLFFNSINHLTIRDVTFSNCAAFAIQAGEIENSVFENISFVSCYADGLHFGGNIKNIYIKDVKGNVGDDLVALNMYDWQNSSVNFGPGENIWCENLSLDRDGKYKAIRLEPGTYYFDDGTTVDCALKNVVVKSVRGIRTFKLYMQTPPYSIGQLPEKGDVGSAENIVFEDIEADFFAPIDKFKEYMESDPLRGTSAVFELGANINGLKLKNIHITMHKDDFPESYLVCIGPKSIVRNGKEVFDPYISCKAENISVEDVFVNDKKLMSSNGYFKEIEFEDVNKDGNSTGRGQFERITVK